MLLEFQDNEDEGRDEARAKEDYNFGLNVIKPLL